MRIATFNCNSVRTRLDTVLRWMQDHQPDALCLQETKVQDSEFPLEAFTSAGLNVAFRGMKAYNGVAIVSPHPIEDVHAGLDNGGPADEPRLIRGNVRGVTIVNTYIPQGRDIEHEMFRYKLAWFQRLRGYFDRHFKPSDPLAWLGDINVAAEPIDVHNPETRENHVCYHADARAAFRHCRAWGFEDVFRNFHPEGGHYTFFDYRTQFRGPVKEGWRIDYILASPALNTRATRSWIDLEPRLREKPSDHTFLAADFT